MIHKFSISLYEPTFIDIQKDARLLCVKEQKNMICAWFLVDLTKEKITRTFIAYVTGYPFDDTLLDYAGTVLLDNGGFVAHVFEVLPSERF